MYLIGHKGVGVAVNREISMATIINQLPDLDDRQLEQVADFIWGVKTAQAYLNK